MADSAVDPSALNDFFRRWEASGAAERANYSMFLNELCDLLEVPRPDPAGLDDEKNATCSSALCHFRTRTERRPSKRIDLYKRECLTQESEARL
jgi:hypothetical protein